MCARDGRSAWKQMEMLAQDLTAVCRAHRRARDSSSDWRTLENPVKEWDVGEPTLDSWREISTVKHN